MDRNPPVGLRVLAAGPGGGDGNRPRSVGRCLTGGLRPAAPDIHERAFPHQPPPRGLQLAGNLDRGLLPANRVRGPALPESRQQLAGSSPRMWASPQRGL